MQEIAQATFNYHDFNEIMPTIFRRFVEKEAHDWRQIYKALQLLEYIVKNGSERVSMRRVRTYPRSKSCATSTTLTSRARIKASIFARVRKSSLLFFPILTRSVRSAARLVRTAPVSYTHLTLPTICSV